MPFLCCLPIPPPALPVVVPNMHALYFWHPELVCIVVKAEQLTWPCACWVLQLQSALAAQVEEPLYFVDFLREPTFDNETGEVIEAHPSFYESIQGGLPDIRKRVEALQRKFNEESKAVKLELVLFQDALTHLMRISRLLAMDRGSVLLVGVGGSGKQSLSRLAAYIAGKLGYQSFCFDVVLVGSWCPVQLMHVSLYCRFLILPR